VLTVIYLIFNEGYVGSSGDSLVRGELCDEAIRLGRLLATLMPDEPEVLGLLALMRLHLARSDARFDADGSLILLPDQDRSRWDRAAIDAASALLASAERMNRPGPYQLQAAILAVHAAAPSWAGTPWRAVVALYDALHRLQPTPVVALNRALALAELDGPRAALDAIAPLADRLDGYHLYHAARGELLRRVGDATAAREANRRALALTDNPAERRLLEERLAGA
jgi:RNA polymerase sigma-70 factor (ECF subfamily)